MEVHHPHHVHHKKKWTEYITEFVMLFAAVTLGFFAENQRESYIERHRELQYMETLMEDLKRDTAELNTVKRSYTKQIGKLDSTIALFYKQEYSLPNLKTLYVLNLSTLGNRGVKLTERTSAQLKNAGGMRLIENKDVSNLIALYWHWSEFIQSYGNTTEELKIKAREKSYSIFDQRYYKNIERGNANLQVTDDVKLMTYDYNTLAEYTNRLSHVKNSIKNVQIYMVDETKKVADSLITIISKQYDIH